MEVVQGARNEKLVGGLGDGKPDGAFDPDELAKGIQFELEHTDNLSVAKEIAKDHLMEDPEYYSKAMTGTDHEHGKQHLTNKTKRVGSNGPTVPSKMS